MSLRHAWNGPGRVATEPASEHGLDLAFVQGERWALEAAYRRWSPLVHTVALRVLGHDQDAQDVTQEVFLKAWRSRSGYDPSVRPLPAWLTGIARHTVSDRLSLHSRDKRLRERVDARFRDTGDGGSAESVVDAVVVADLLGQLDEPRRTVIELAFFSGMTHAEICERTGMPLGTVKSHVRRGLGQLRERLEVADATP